LHARAPTVRWSTCLTLVVALCTGSGARAASGHSRRLVVGGHDPGLAAALAVAMGSQGLTVVESEQELNLATDVPTAQAEAAGPDVVAVVWLCQTGAAERAICLCDPSGHLQVRPVVVPTPLTPPDAAALALSVKLMLASASPPHPAPSPPTPRAEPPARAPPGVPPPTPPTSAARAISPSTSAADTGPPVLLSLEIEGGARQDRAPGGRALGARFGGRATWTPAVLAGHLAAGLGVQVGPLLDDGERDTSLGFFARGRWPLAPLQLELDLGASEHVLTASGHAGVSALGAHAELTLDGTLGAVWPFGRYFAGARAGGGYAPSARSLPSFSPQALITLGVTTR
jgi:hypothetical protein